MKSIMRLSTALVLLGSVFATRCDLQHELNYGKINQIRNAEEFYYAVQNAEYVFVKCSATWCGPCKKLDPIVRQLANKYQDVLFIAIDVDQLKSLSRSLGVRSYPTIFLYKNGSRVGIDTGYKVRSHWEKRIRNLFGV